MTKRVLGVIGGSGIYDLPGLKNLQEHKVSTPYGEPSSPLMVGELGETTCVFLARHGIGHRILPHEINYRANLYALKSMGVQWILSISAVGSLREDIHPGDIVIVDQFFDRTTGRQSSFFGEGIAAHVSLADPISPVMSSIVYQVACERAEASKRDFKVHKNGTYMVMNGPQFSTRAESKVYRSWGMDVIGMTNMPEAKLAREAEMSYCTIALSTDYDCWHEGEEDVSVEAVLAIVKTNAEFAKDVVAHLPARLPDSHDCIACNALQYSIMTSPELFPEESVKRLGPILTKYLSK